MWRIIPLLLAPAIALADVAPAFEEPQGPLTLQRAIDAALTNSPDLAPFAWDVRIGDARIIQARLRPNPELSVELENIVLGGGADRSRTTQSLSATPPAISLEPGDINAGQPPLVPQVSRGGTSMGIERERQSGTGGFGNVEVTLSLSQVIELGGKRAARIATAERERAVMEWDYEVARFDVIGDVLIRFTEVLAAQERVRQEQTVVDLADKLSSTVEQLVEAGDVSPLEARRAKAAAEQARLNLRTRENEVQQARLRLATVWGSTKPAFAKALGDVSAIPALPSLESILQLRGDHPMLKRWGAELARRGAVFRQARAQRVPDMTVRLGYRATAVDEGDTQAFGIGSDGFTASRSDSSGDDWEHSLVLEASLPLPIFHRNQGAIREAELNQEKLGDEQRAWESELTGALSELHAIALASHERIEGLAQRILPELETTYALTQEGYQRGKFAFLAVLDAQRAVVDSRMDLLEARIAYQQAVADMERLVGASIAGNFDIPRTETISASAEEKVEK